MGEHQMEDCGPLYAGSKKAAVNWFYGTPWFVATSEEVLKGQQWWVCQQALCTVQTKSQWLHNVSNFAGRRDFLPPGRHCSLNWCVWHIFRTEISCSGVVWFEDDCSFKVVCSLFPISRVYISHLWKQRCFFFLPSRVQSSVHLPCQGKNVPSTNRSNISEIHYQHFFSSSLSLTGVI